MFRLFVGLSLPEDVTGALLALQGGVPGARWQSEEQLHLTLRFIGEADGRTAGDIDEALAAIRAPGFELALFGTGAFGSKEPTALYAGVRPNPALEHLRRKVNNALRRLDVAADTKKFTAHVTIARLRGADRQKLTEFLAANALFAAPVYFVPQFHLYESTLTPNGSLYNVERDYPLSAPGR